MPVALQGHWLEELQEVYLAEFHQEDWLGDYHQEDQQVGCHLEDCHPED